MTDPGPDDQPEVLLSVDDGVASIILNRPARKNAITGPMMDRLAEAFQEAAVRDDVGAVLFHGADGGFCSGLDLGEYNADPPPAWLSTSLDSLVAAHRAIYACPVPVVGALERFAINGGAAFALACVIGITYVLLFRELKSKRLGFFAARLPSLQVLDAMNADSGLPVTRLKVDGGMTANHLLMQCVADVLDLTVERPLGSEAVSLGAAYAAGLAVGYWPDPEVLRRNWHRAAAWEPTMDPGLRRREHDNWRRAVQRSTGWARPD